MQCFRLLATSVTATVHVTLRDIMSKQTRLKGMVITQLPVNVNDVTTRNELQGMSKDKLIVVTWTFMHNWIYVVLSCVQTLDGLCLLRPLPYNCLDNFEVPKDLKRFKDRVYAFEVMVFSARKRNIQATGQQLQKH